jgi:hypothetical protein
MNSADRLSSKAEISESRIVLRLLVSSSEMARGYSTGCYGLESMTAKAVSA